MMYRVSVRWLALAAALGLAATTVLLAANGVANRVKGLRTTLRFKSGDAAVVRVCVGDAWMDRERRGFFKIGLLPVLVAEDVKLEVLEPGSLAETLAALPGLLHGGRKKLPIELRNFSLYFPANEAPRLSANLVKFADDGTWRLSGKVQWWVATNRGQTQHAWLSVAGSRSGWLSLLRSNTPVQVDLFADERVSPIQPTSE